MKYLPLIILVLSIGIALIFRVALPFPYVFNNGVQLNTVDAYIMVRYADCWPNIPSHDYFIDYPAGAGVGSVVWPSVIAIFGRIFNIDNMIAAAILPVILFLLTLIPLYIVGRTLYGHWVGIGAVGIFCLLPGEILNRTMLGAADYHAWEIWLSTNIMAMVICAAYNYHKYIDLFSFSVGALLLWILYWYSWAGALWLIFIVVVYITILIFVNTRNPVYMGMYLLGGLGLVACVYLLYPTLTQFYANEAAKIFTVNIAQTVTEEMPIFFSFGKFDLNTSWLYFGVVFYIALVGIGWIAYRYYKYRRSYELAFFIWTIVTLAMMIARRRYDYYFAVNVAVIAAFVMVYVARYLSINKATKIKIGVVILMAVCLPLIRADYAISTMDTYMPQDWQNITQDLRNHGDDKAYATGEKSKYGVFSWWDYGFWIVTNSHLPAYRTPSTQATGQEALILVATDTEQAVASLRTLNMRFVVVDEEMLESKWYPIISAAGVNVEKEKTLVYKLCTSEKVEGFTLVYQSGKVKAYQVN